jgi:hypothetical protein
LLNCANNIAFIRCLAPRGRPGSPRAGRPYRCVGHVRTRRLTQNTIVSIPNQPEEPAKTVKCPRSAQTATGRESWYRLGRARVSGSPMANSRHPARRVAVAASQIGSYQSDTTTRQAAPSCGTGRGGYFHSATFVVRTSTKRKRVSALRRDTLARASCLYVRRSASKRRYPTTVGLGDGREPGRRSESDRGLTSRR